MKIDKYDFKFEIVGYGHYRVTYTSPVTGKQWTTVTNNMPLIDATRNSEERKPGYNAARVERNNIRRELWNFHCDGAFNAREERDALDALDGCQWGDMDIGIHE